MGSYPSAFGSSGSSTISSSGGGSSGSLNYEFVAGFQSRNQSARNDASFIPLMLDEHAIDQVRKKVHALAQAKVIIMEKKKLEILVYCLCDAIQLMEGPFSVHNFIEKIQRQQNNAAYWNADLEVEYLVCDDYLQKESERTQRRREKRFERRRRRVQHTFPPREDREKEKEKEKEPDEEQFESSPHEDEIENNDGTGDKFNLKLKLLINDTVFFSKFPAFVTQMIQKQVKAKYGLMHTGLLFGDMVIDWNESSLVIPRPISLFSPKLTIDICTINLIHDTDKLWKVCNKIVEWNTKSYDRCTSNCQHFVDDILRTIGIQPQFEGALGNAIERLRTVGTLQMYYKCPLNTTAVKELIFESHKQLDNYVLDVLSEHPFFPKTHKHDWALLKSYDRAFWLQYVDNEDDEGKPSGCCPFGDPIKSGTIILG